MEQGSLNCKKQLEFDKICGFISALAVCDEAKARARDTEPSTDIAEAEFAMGCCDEMCRMLSAHSSPSLLAVNEVVPVALRAKKGGILSMGELLRIRALLRNAAALNSWYGSGKGDGEAGQYFFMLYEDQLLEREIGSSILSESEMSDDASRELRAIRRQIAREESSIRDKLDSIIRGEKTQKYLQDSVVSMRGGRFVVPVKTEHRGQIKGLIHDVSSSGSTYFVEPEAVVEANNRIMQLKGDEEREIERILAAFTERVGGIADSLVESYKAMVEIDLYIARARWALSVKAMRPRLNSEGHISLKKARHPLINSQKVVPVDVELGGDYTTLVITGPNTGGKTVTLKTVGLLTLLAMSGIPIPAAEGSEIAVFDNILCDIGDEQSIEQSLSTFSGHVRNISEILRHAGCNSLTLLDELGAGTDPAEGAALAVAILERLRSLGSRVLATTHYGEIKIYALETAGVQNASCEFDVATLSPTYRLTIGIPGRSNALLIGERLGLDGELLAEARRNLSSENRRFEDVLSEIERVKAAAAEREAAAEQKTLEAARKLADAQKEYEKLVAQGQNELEATRRKARELSADLTAGAGRLLDEIRQLEKDKSTRRQEVAARAREIARREAVRIADMAPEYAEVKAEQLEPLESASVGDSVYVPALGSVAQVLSVSGDSVEIKAGPIKSRVPVSALRRPPAGQSYKKEQRRRAAKAESGGRSEEVPKRSAQNELNLIGMTVDEAVMELDSFIDRAILAHLNTLYIIHGRGTGALRAGVQARLRAIKQVKSFRLGRYGEGEDGVTIVELK